MQRSLQGAGEEERPFAGQKISKGPVFPSGPFACVKRKAAGKTLETPEPQEDRGNVIDLMDALKQSMKGRKSAGTKGKGVRKRKAG